MRLLSPKEVVGKKLVRIGHDYDGGYVMVDDIENCIAYSFGIADDVSWDLGMAYRGVDVYMYDHTIKKLPTQHERFHFFKNGICGENDRGENLKTFRVDRMIEVKPAEETENDGFGSGRQNIASFMKSTFGMNFLAAI